MKLDRIGAVALFLQGVMPALVFGIWRAGGLFLLIVAVIYAVLAWGVWSSKRWSVIAAILFTVPQLFIISSKLFSWQFLIGGATGVGIAPSSSLFDSRISSFFSLGARFDFAVSERCPSLLANYTYIGSERFILLNAVAFLIIAILLSIVKRRAKVPI